MKKTLIKILISIVMVFNLSGFLSIGVAPTEVRAETLEEQLENLIKQQKEKLEQRLEEGEGEEGLLKGVWCASLTGGLNPTGCVVVMSSAVYSITANVLSVSGSFFDTLLMFSLDRNLMEQDFVADSWKNIRGFANMMFILVLVAVSISIILGFGKFNSKELIRDVILIALVVNFSLFAARVVIDAGNIVALGFYDAIAAPPRTDPVLSTTESGLKEKNISGAIMSTFNPAQLIDVKAFDAWKEAYVGDYDGGKNAGERSSNMALAFIFLIATGFNVYTAFIFLKAGIIFVVRVAYLWIIMILSPLAFISYIIPPMREYWHKWWNELFNKSFCIVVFLFFLWLTLTITSSNFFKTVFDVDNPGFIRLITVVLLQATIVFVLLGKTLSETEKMCNDGGLGDKVGGMLKKGAGLAAGVATGGASLIAKGAVGGVVGGASLALRQGVGGWAQRKAEKDTKAGRGTTRFGALRLKALRGIGETKFGTKEGYKKRTERVAGEHLKYQESLPEKAYDEKGNVVSKPQEEYATNVGKRSVVTNVLAYAGMKVAGEEKFTAQYQELIDAQKELAIERGKLDQMNKKTPKTDADRSAISMQSTIISGKQSRVNKIKKKIEGLKKAAEPKKDDKKKKDKKKKK